MLEHRQDESLWAAAWLHRATNEQLYLDVLGQAGQRGGARTEFSCNDKCLGAQLLVAKVQSSWYSILTTRRQFFFHFFVSLLRCFLRLLVLEGKVESAGLWGQYRFDAEAFLCNCAQKDTGNFGKTPGGMLWFLPWANLRYVGASSLAAVSYASYLTANKATIQCPGCSVSASDLYALGRSQLPDRL